LETAFEGEGGELVSLQSTSNPGLFFVRMGEAIEDQTHPLALVLPNYIMKLAWWQGLTLVHFLAQPAPFLSMNALKPTETTQRVP